MVRVKPVMGYEQWEVTCEASRRVALLGVAFHVLGDAVEEDEESTVCLGSSYGLTLCSPRICPDTGWIERLLTYTLGKAWLELLPDGIVCGCAGSCTGSTEQIMRELIRTYERGLESHILSKTLTGKEYFLAVGWNGMAAVAEGESREVHVPGVPLVVFMHTHPGGVCLPSSRDLESFAEFFSRGGLLAGVYSANCRFLLWLRQPLRVEDYDRLIMLAQKLKKVREYYDYMRELESELDKSSSIGYILELV